MQEIWRGRVAQAAGKYGEHAPMATACCNACRTCVTTNVLTLAMGGLTGLGVLMARLARNLRASCAA
jgi:hypothetical protein